MFPEFVAVIAPVSQHHLAAHFPDHFLGGQDLMFISRAQVDGESLAVAIDTGIEFGIPASLGLSQSPLLRGLWMAAGVLVHFDMGGIDHLEKVMILGLRDCREK